MQQPKEIALAFPRGAHQEMFIDGVLRYASEANCNWTYVTAPESLALSILELRGWQGDGVIAALNTSTEATIVKELNMPIVNMSSSLVDSPVPRVIVDNQLIGNLAADHLLERGFQRYAFYGLKNVAYSRLRWKGFEARLAEKGFSSSSMLSTATFALRGTRWQRQHRALADWISSLPTPVALFAVTDYRARQALDACRRVGIKVPQQVAVLGVDNEEVICRHVQPQLSSIARNNGLEGYRAAAMLDRLMQGDKITENESIPPLGVVQRGSTDIIAVSDGRVREAIDYINRRLSELFDVHEVAQHLGVSRRWLEYAFRDQIGESPYQYIRRKRLERARDFLEKQPTMKISRIAEEAGFSSGKHLTMTFRHSFGMSPREYRRSHQNDSL